MRIEKRNIVLITWDSVRADHCSFMGYNRVTTPTLDKMARKGLYFENAISPAHATLPSMKAIFTGEFLGQHESTLKGVSERTLHEFRTQTTIAETLRKKGYHTVGFSSNAWASSYFGFDKGFEYFVDPFYKKSGSKLYKKIFNKIDRSKMFSVLRNVKNMILKNEVFSIWEKYYGRVINYLEKIQEPFFFWVFLTDTHLPYYSPKVCRIYSSIFDMNLLNIYYTWKLKSSDFIIEPTERMLNTLINAYDDSIRYADLFVKQFWKDLSSFDPIFLIHADHGEGFYEHGFFGHYHPRLYEEDIHVPFIIYNSNLKGVIRKPISLKDMRQIILKLLQSENNKSLDIFDNFPEVIFSQALGGSSKLSISVRSNYWKYIFKQNGLCELYNLKTDPFEKKNLVNECPQVSSEMNKIVRYFISKEQERNKIRHISKEKLKFSSGVKL